MLVAGIDSNKAILEASATELANTIGKGFSKEKFDALKSNIVSFMESAQGVWSKMGENIKEQQEKVK